MNFADLPPPAVLYQLATGYYISRALYVAAQLGIADHLKDGPRSAEELAEATSAHAPSLRRVLRLLASAGVFAEQEDGAFALTPLSEWLRSDMPGSFRSATLLFTGPLEWASWGALPHTVQTGEMALRHVFGVDAFEYMEEHPQEGAIFDEAMAAFTNLAAVAVAAVYDFTPFRHVVDVGGGNGALMLGILKANPHLRGTVFDLPRAIEGARKQIAAAGMAERCDAVGGDFFEAVPGAGDAYLIKHVIHDWNDERATQILRTCHRAMKPEAKLLLVEGVYPKRVEANLESRGAALNDVNMLVVTGGRQRSEAEFRQLYEAAGFRLTRIVPTMAAACVIEGERV
jgi:hypothetical protein